MLLGGIWHGAGWTFIVYGLCHGSYVVIHQLWRIKVSGPLNLVGRRDYKAAAQVFTFLVVALTLVVFRADSIVSAGDIYSAMFDWNGLQFATGYAEKLQHNKTLELASMLFGQGYAASVVFILLAMALSVCWFLPSTYQLFRNCDVVIDRPLAGREPVISLNWKATAVWGIFVGILAVSALVNLTQVSEFLYFQF